MDMPTFDELRDLARRDPEGFERLRSELIETVFAAVRDAINTGCGACSL